MLIIPKPPKPVAPAPVEAHTLADVVQALHGSPFKLAEQWNLNYRTSLKRIAAPQTITVLELQALAEILRVEPVDLLAVIALQLNRSVPERPVALKAKTLAELIAASPKDSIIELAAELKIDYRTATKRAEQPDTLLLGELFALATVLKADPAALLRVIAHELRVSPPPARPKRGRVKGAKLPEGDAPSQPNA
ncbi:MAG TPA: hypothetical protein VF629_02955 [Hymenobacter sp.]|jgi:hypothetical protein|uniref:hypothetical protein n=1 Tax=Hymenobacter sp. TaxID=1898978 RepID=UPI002ED82E3A